MKIDFESESSKIKLNVSYISETIVRNLIASIKLKRFLMLQIKSASTKVGDLLLVYEKVSDIYKFELNEFPRAH